jgi:hypothetical protein
VQTCVRAASVVLSRTPVENRVQWPQTASRARWRGIGLEARAYPWVVETLAIVLGGFTVGLLGVAFVALYGRGASGGPQTDSEHALRARYVARFAFGYSSLLAIVCLLAGVLISAEAAGVVVLVLAVTVIVAVGARREHQTQKIGQDRRGTQR